MQRNEKKVERLFDEGEELALSEDLEEADNEDVLKRKRLLEQRWNNVTKHLWDRQNRWDLSNNCSSVNDVKLTVASYCIHFLPY